VSRRFAATPGVGFLLARTQIAVMFADVRSALHGIAGALRRGDSASRPHAASRAGGHSFVASAVPDPGDATLPFVSFETTLLS